MTAERALHELQLDMRGQIEKYDQLQEARRSVPDLLRMSGQVHRDLSCSFALVISI